VRKGRIKGTGMENGMRTVRQGRMEGTRVHGRSIERKTSVRWRMEEGRTTVKGVEWKMKGVGVENR